jgi:PAS domain-containing protein
MRVIEVIAKKIRWMSHDREPTEEANSSAHAAGQKWKERFMWGGAFCGGVSSHGRSWARALVKAGSSFLSVWAMIFHGGGAMLAERKRAMESARQSYLELEERVALRTQELSRIHESLKRSESRLREALNAGVAFTFEWDFSSDALLRSDSSTTILGLPGGGERDTGQRFLQSVEPEDRSRVIEVIRACTPERSKCAPMTAPWSGSPSAARLNLPPAGTYPGSMGWPATPPHAISRRKRSTRATRASVKPFTTRPFPPQSPFQMDAIKRLIAPIVT